MDVSPEYVNMCDKAKEIQAIRPKLTSPLSGKSTGKPYVYTFCDFFDSQGNVWVITQASSVWLPRQDDLQGMIFGVEINTEVAGFKASIKSHWTDWLIELAWFVYKWKVNKEKIRAELNPEATYYESMEQLWLAFVMFELYHKKWHNGEWGVENDRDTKNSQDAPFR